MIISHEHRFIFIRTVKTASTSLEISLSCYCGKDDIVTPLSRTDEMERKKLGVFPRNYLKIPQEYPEKNPGPDDKKIFWNHVSAAYVKEQLDEKIWNSYFKFCFERNPWDKVVSMYFYERNQPNGKKISFDEYIISPESEKFVCYNFPILTMTQYWLILSDNMKTFKMT